MIDLSQCAAIIATLLMGVSVWWGEGNQCNGTKGLTICPAWLWFHVFLHCLHYHHLLHIGLDVNGAALWRTGVIQLQGCRHAVWVQRHTTEKSFSGLERVPSYFWQKWLWNLFGNVYFLLQITCSLKLFLKKNKNQFEQHNTYHPDEHWNRISNGSPSALKVF